MVNNPKPTKVVIADDDDDDFLILSEAFSETAVPLVLSRVEDGEKLLVTLAGEIPDILFLDLLMPCVDGKQCLRILRSDKRYDNLPIVVYSSLNQDEEIDACFAHGANRYAIKPASLAELIEILKNILSIQWTDALRYPPRSEFVLNARRK